MINTNALKTNQIFKNYKELCEYLDEPIKTGKSKQLQLKDWERYFSYEKEGQKFIKGLMEIAANMFNHLWTM